MQLTNTQLVIGGAAVVGLVLLFGREPGRTRNLEASPDWDEAWLRLQEAWKYHLLKKDREHVYLRLREATDHADKLPRNQRAILHEKIDELASKYQGLSPELKVKV